MRALTRLASALLVAIATVACGSDSSDSGPASSSAAAPASAASAPAAAAGPCAAGAAVPPSRVPGAPLDTVLRVLPRARGHRAPLVLALHFAGGTASEMEEATRLTPEARRDGFVVAYPERASSRCA